MDALETSVDERNTFDALNTTFRDIVARMMQAKRRFEELRATYSEIERALLQTAVSDAFLRATQRRTRLVGATIAAAGNITNDPRVALVLQIAGEALQMVHENNAA